LSTRAFDPIEEALARGASPEDVLDIVDAAIEGATRRRDAATLAALADVVDARATERGGDWRGLAIAALRARAAGIPTAEATPPALPASSQAAETPFAGWWSRTGAFLLELAPLGLVYWLLAERSDINGDLAVFIWLFLPLVYFAGCMQSTTARRRARSCWGSLSSARAAGASVLDGLSSAPSRRPGSGCHSSAGSST
jgi:hypothetical protein